MPSATYDLFAEAMHEEKQIFCMYDGHPRELCAVVLGHTKGEEKALTFQVGGRSKQGPLPVGGEWRCLFLAKVQAARLRSGPLRVGAGHSRPQGCVEEVDLDINPNSPYHPKRRIRRS
ncbi:MAG TPA: hypothetical protein VKV96_21235 [Roseiarcus sp.]|nr:hypothetical protein [Roseiarcus sp.]